MNIFQLDRGKCMKRDKWMQMWFEMYVEIADKCIGTSFKFIEN